MSEQKTLGQRRVRLNFNPSKIDTVHEIKVKAAELIDLIDGIQPLEADLGANASDFHRCKAKAMTDVETAAMFAVKAATYSKD